MVLDGCKQNYAITEIGYWILSTLMYSHLVAAVFSIWNILAILYHIQHVWFLHFFVGLHNYGIKLIM